MVQGHLAVKVWLMFYESMTMPQISKCALHFAAYIACCLQYLTGETNVQDFVRVQNAEIVTNFYRSLRSGDVNLLESYAFNVSQRYDA